MSWNSSSSRCAVALVQRGARPTVVADEVAGEHEQVVELEAAGPPALFHGVAHVLGHEPEQRAHRRPAHPIDRRDARRLGAGETVQHLVLGPAPAVLAAAVLAAAQPPGHEQLQRLEVVERLARLLRVHLELAQVREERVALDAALRRECARPISQ